MRFEGVFLIRGQFFPKNFLKVFVLNWGLYPLYRVRTGFLTGGYQEGGNKGGARKEMKEDGNKQPNIQRKYTDEKGPPK
ncbi:MAG: hypothetical protein ACK5EK_07470 [Flavobacteriia bacterium]